MPIYHRTGFYPQAAWSPFVLVGLGFIALCTGCESPSHRPAVNPSTDGGWALSFGTFEEGAKQVAVGEGSGQNQTDAVSLAQASARKALSELRSTQVQSLSKSYKDLQGSNDFSQEVELRSSSSISGGHFGEPEIRRDSDGSYLARVRFEVPTRFILPNNYLQEFKGEELRRECEDLLNEAESFDPPDLTLAGISLRILLREDPILEDVFHLVNLYEQAGRPQDAMHVLEQFRHKPELKAQDADNAMAARIQKLSEPTTDMLTLVDRLDRIALGDTDLKALHQLVTYDRQQVLTGYVEAGSSMRLFWMDDDELARVPLEIGPDKFPSRGGADSKLAIVNHSLPSFENYKESFALGHTRLLVLTSTATLASWPRLAKKISFKAMGDAKTMEIRRFDEFVNELTEWVSAPEHQATIVNWEQIR
ncbi:MAG: hypothetical protein ACI841_004034 [Planctomycetota bacterium]|jgi:hypothetical protein